MIRLLPPDADPTKIALFLEEAKLPYEIVPVDTAKGSSTRPRVARATRTARCRVSAIAPARAVSKRVFEFNGDPALSRREDRRADGFARRPRRAAVVASFHGFRTRAVLRQAVHPASRPGEKLPYAVNRYRARPNATMLSSTSTL